MNMKTNNVLSNNAYVEAMQNPLEAAKAELEAYNKSKLPQGEVKNIKMMVASSGLKQIFKQNS